MQTAFEVRVSPGGTDPRRPDADLIATVASAGDADGGDPFVELPTPLAPDSTCAWSVRVRDEHGDWSDWAAPSRVETGPWELSDWSAQWVAHPPLSILRREFELASPVRAARLHLTAQGLVRASVNGVAVNPASSDPSRTDRARALYRSYDVTDLIRSGAGAAGANTLDLALASGEWARTGLDPRVLAEVVVHLADGGVLRAGTGEGLLSAAGPVTVEEPFYLERHEATSTPPEFGPASAARVLRPDASPQSPPSDVAPDPSPPVHRVAAHGATLLVCGEGYRVYDVGTNIAGRTGLAVRTRLPEDSIIRVVHGEQLGADGRIDTTNLTMPYDRGRVRQAVEYVVSGQTDSVLTPWFCYHGFRYVEVLGLPAEADAVLEAWSLHSDLESSSELHTDDPQVNALADVARRTLLNNVHGIPEDCPTREQSGWTGDTASAAEFDFSVFDMQGFFTKWLGDLRTSQQPDGSIPAISPDLRDPRILPDPVWGAALHRVLLGHWLHYGDARVVRDTLPTLRRWADHLLTLRTQDGVIGHAPISYGSDWLALAQTPPPLHHTMATIDCLDSLATLEESVGEADAAEVRRAAADQLREAARAAFFDDRRDVFGNSTQAADAIGIEGRILSPAERERAAERIASDVRSHGNRVTSGFATTRTVVRALARSGYSQVVFDALHQPDEPGIGAMVDHGPGTFWECWWIDPLNTGTGSLDHIGLGGPFAGWAWQWLAGVRPTGAGWSDFVAEPQFVSGVDSLTLSSRTVRGIVGLSYRIDAETIAVTLTVPVGTRAELRLPGGITETLGSGVLERTLSATLRPAGRRSAAPRDESAWIPPWRPAPSSDVEGERDWLARSIAAGTASAASSASVEILPDGIRCMPVPHEQPFGPVALVRSRRSEPSDGEDDEGIALLRVPPGDVVNPRAGRVLQHARFVYALLDLCTPNPPGALESIIIVHGADGTSMQATGTIWPAGWNRVSVEIADLAARTAITGVEIGIRTRPDGNAATNAGPYDAADPTPLAFHLGEVGYSAQRRTW
jgi:alpha-L-rhamnosidase